MRKNIMFVVLLLIVVFMAAGNIGSVAAQDSADNFTFDPQAQWLDSSYFARVGGAVNYRSVPTQYGNTEFGTFRTGVTVEVVATFGTGNGTWLLARGWNAQNQYVGAGWINQQVANLNRLDSFTPPALTACPLTDRGVQINVNIRYNNGWVHDAHSTACTLFYEGRVEETELHNYWVVRDSNVNATATVTREEYLQSGFFWLLEGTGWIHPTTWAIGRGMRTNFTGQSLRYPPMVAYFAADKQQVMAREGYAWPFAVHLVNGTSLSFEYGAFGTASNTVNRCELEEPREMPLSPIYNSTSRTFRSTSIGAENCRSLIFWQLPDNSYQLFQFTGTDENLEFKFVFASYLIPSDWTSDELRQWVLDEIVPLAGLPTGTTVNVTGIQGLTTFTTR